MLEAQHLTLTRTGRTLLHNLSVQIRPGESTAIVGPNGAGKSTLLRLLAGAMPATAGDVLLDGKPLAHYTPTELARRRAVLSQQVLQPFPYSVEEVIAMGRVALGTSRTENRQAVEAAVESLNLHTLAHRPYQQLSGGEQQRVQLGRVLAQLWQPTPDANRYLLLDEPTASLDLLQQHQALLTATSALGPRTGLVAVVHDLNLAAAYFDHIVFLKGGICHSCGEVHRTLTRSAVEQVFGQSVLVQPHPLSGRPLVIPCVGHCHSAHAHAAHAHPSVPHSLSTPR